MSDSRRDQQISQIDGDDKNDAILKSETNISKSEELPESGVTILKNFQRASADLQTHFAYRAVQENSPKWPKKSVKSSEEEWKIIEASNDIDFADFKDEVVKVEDEEVDTAIKINRDTSNAPPPPPPMPPPPPPPIGRTLPQFSSGIVHEPYRQRTLRFHWSVDGVEAIPSTVWHSLPPVPVDEDEILDLFRDKTAEKVYKIEEKMKKFIETLPLNRSRNIQVARNKLPDLGTLKESILSLEGPLTKENLEQLVKCKPSRKEMEIIQTEMNKSPNLPLGKADELLWMLGAIPELEEKLKLWTFKLEFQSLERGISEPLGCLKSTMKILKSDKVFPTVLSVTLTVGNILNKNTCFGDKRAFAIDSLNKLSNLKDKTSSNLSLLHHVSKKVIEIHPDPSNLYQVIPPLNIVSKVEFKELEKSMEAMEAECKQLLGLVASLSPEVKNVFKNAAKKIICLKQVHGSVMMKYTKFLEWLGIHRDQHEENNPQIMAGSILTFVKNFKETVVKINEDAEKAKMRMGKRSVLKRVESMPADLHRQSNKTVTLHRAADRVIRTRELNPRKPELNDLEKTLADLLLTPTTKRRMRPPILPPKRSTDSCKEK